MQWFNAGFLVVSTLFMRCVSEASAEEQFRINITNLQNCDDVSLKDVGVYMTSGTYECDSTGICDIVHGKYTVKYIELGKRELVTTFYQCNTDSTGPCNDNPEEYHIPLHCEKFINDDSGPWHMLSQAMSGSRCGEETGDFELVSSKLEYSHLVNDKVQFIKLNDKMRKYRIKLLFHTEGKKSIRACVSVQFILVPRK